MARITQGYCGLRGCHGNMTNFSFLGICDLSPLTGSVTGFCVLRIARGLRMWIIPFSCEKGTQGQFWGNYGVWRMNLGVDFELGSWAGYCNVGFILHSLR